ncbi:MAG TPA: hypothetical protein VEK73_19785 [Xanthobacteraceae bacterium]|nr:hypothetical protein [Xanthobacteraceae bacterium]
MRLRSSAIFHLACSLGVVSAAALAYGIASHPAAREGALQHVTFAAPAETVVVRSPAERNAAAAKLRAAEETAAADRALFIPRPTYPPATVLAQAAPVQTPAARKPAQMRLASVATKPALPAPDRGRPGAVLNDAQIASIKQRLNLTPEQERMWPSVEAALRNLAYAKTAGAPHKSGGRDALQAVASIDPSGADVQNLKAAAFPLIMSFSDDQMRELQDITRVAGLDKLVSKF